MKNTTRSTTNGCINTSNSPGTSYTIVRTIPLFLLGYALVRST